MDELGGHPGGVEPTHFIDQFVAEFVLAQRVGSGCQLDLKHEELVGHEELLVGVDEGVGVDGPDSLVNEIEVENLDAFAVLSDEPVHESDVNPLFLGWGGVDAVVSQHGKEMVHGFDSLTLDGRLLQHLDLLLDGCGDLADFLPL